MLEYVTRALQDPRAHYHLSRDGTEYVLCLRHAVHTVPPEYDDLSMDEAAAALGWRWFLGQSCVHPCYACATEPSS